MHWESSKSVMQTLGFRNKDGERIIRLDLIEYVEFLESPGSATILKIHFSQYTVTVEGELAHTLYTKIREYYGHKVEK